MSEPYLLRAKDIARLVGIGRSTVWRWTQEGKLPRPVKLGENCTRWKRDEVMAALDKLVEGVRHG